jgi:hypothetical protein
MSFISLKSATVNKMSLRSTGQISYLILTDQDRKSLYITITANTDGGHFSPEIIAFEAIEKCLEGVNLDNPIFSKMFAKAFVSKSTNNAGFLAAVLRAENLIVPQVDVIRKHIVNPIWDDWKELMLMEDGVPYEPPPPKPKGVVAAVIAESKPTPKLTLKGSKKVVVIDVPKPTDEVLDAPVAEVVEVLDAESN